MANTVKVSNVSLGASEQDIKELFSFSGEIDFVEMKSETERSQVAYVTFKDTQGPETAILLSGATIVDMQVTIVLDPEYVLPPNATAASQEEGAEAKRRGNTALQKAEDVVSGMLEKGLVLGKDAVSKAKSFDEKHRLTSTASAKVISMDRKIGLTDKISMGTSMVNDKVREVDQKFHVLEKTRSAIAAAEQGVAGAGSAVMRNRYVSTGTSWFSDMIGHAKKAAVEVGQKTKEKLVPAEEEDHAQMKTPDDFTMVHLADSHEGQKNSKKEEPKGLIL